MSRYVNIATRIWHDEKFRELPDDAKMLFLCLLTSPHGNMCGIFYLPPLYACHDLRWTEKRYQAAIEQLKTRKIVAVDGDIILIKNFLRYNPIKGPKQAVGAANRLKEVPATRLIECFLDILERYTTEDDYQKFINTYDIPYQYPIDTPPIPESVTDTESVTESDPETDTERKTPKQSKVKYADFVKMTPEEHQKLIDQFGPIPTTKMIEILDNYKGASGKTYKSDYRAILTWVVNRWREDNGHHQGNCSQDSGQGTELIYKYD
ncbi:MAG: hypothetical protein QME44_04535 [Thermodesulfobacteriota bacterium]|nr:hypothetical protein [Thermodesulfobacteriota bacterium]